MRADLLGWSWADLKIVFNEENDVIFANSTAKFKLVKFKLKFSYRGRPIGLVAIVAYKLMMTLLFAATAIGLLLTLKNVESLQDLAETYQLEGKHQIIVYLLDKFLNITPKTLKFAGFAAAGYSALSSIEAIGLWKQKGWAHLLVLGLVGISIPAEIYEIFKHVTVIKVGLFGLNVVMFGYLFVDYIKNHEHQRSRK